VRAFYSDHYVLPLPAGHRFPMAKYARLRARVENEVTAVRLAEAPGASDAELMAAHDPNYVQRAVAGGLDAAEVRAIGFPWSAALIERSRRSVGATIAACRAACADGVAANLAGGTHHAAAARGAGYCVFNDAAVAARALQSDALGAGRRLDVAIVDLDVHQGDGTAQIFRADPSVFTLSIHAEANYPSRKQTSDLDVALPDRTGDRVYLNELRRSLDELTRRFAAQFLLYVSGADAHENDRLGRLALTLDGMRLRDELVFSFAERLGVPIVVMMAGGYGNDLDTTVDVHLQTLRVAVASWQRRAQRCVA
jgi:acetoin utilization deacetylase AcuC-like enzyme